MPCKAELKHGTTKNQPKGFSWEGKRFPCTTRLKHRDFVHVVRTTVVPYVTLKKNRRTQNKLMSWVRACIHIKLTCRPSRQRTLEQQSTAALNATLVGGLPSAFISSSNSSKRGHSPALPSALACNLQYIENNITGSASCVAGQDSKPSFVTHQRVVIT